ncbi:MAG: hypothetical protein GX200_00080 [Firmicutes bacterium]|nr:hypothetical protein [Bacillota bacterium]
MRAFSQILKQKVLARKEFAFHLGLFSACIHLFLVNKYCLKRLINHPFLHFYFHDLLAPLLLLSYSNMLLAWFNFRGRRIRSLPAILLLVLAAGLFWEYVTPLYLPHSTSDPLDLLAYLAGGMLYWLLVSFSAPYDQKGGWSILG